MAGITFSTGLISNFPTADLIDSTIALEANQQTLLAKKKSTLSSQSSALQALNAKVASLTAAAKSAATASSWEAVKAKSSAESVTATTTSDARPSSVSFRVDSVAASQSTLYTLPTGYSSDTPTFTLTGADGETVSVKALSSNIGDIVAAFNAEGTGVKASALNVGTAAAPEYRLQLTGTETGKENTFSLAVDNAADGATLGSKAIREASDAEIVLWPGTGAEQKVTSSKNVFENLVTGVNVTVTAKTTDPVTVDVTRDDSKLAALAQGLVNNLNAVLGDITSYTTSKTSTNDEGTSILTAGLFSGNATIRSLQQSLLAAGSNSANNTSLAGIGITLGKDGTFAFDATAFQTALTNDPDAVSKAVQGVAGSLQKIGEVASDSAKGTLTLQVQSYDSEVKDLTDRIADWDIRLEARRASLTTMYAAMEVQLSNLNSQSDYLTTQLSQLSGSSD
ncbi:flagellar filament capping protein FliD [Cellulomonas sp. IC4_254]|uniref:flagellar filament capping protein FliD n=1 Tax=Cellulomonas sp. IC4_254 TaxID=2714040 RepID=UPI001420318F|nr:flagellar filament capping protein FliD [Cellulomonas sp. IC4_254]NHT16640.1 flagellar filament capping protein FliD [Cellulomonas sp. IC4_254]